VVPPLPLGEGFSSFFDFFFSFGEKVAVRPDEGIRFEVRIMVCF